VINTVNIVEKTVYIYSGIVTRKPAEPQLGLEARSTLG
jgi:hypothetical protein